MTTGIYETYKGKHMFCTGVTGFIGKVLLFKLLKEFPDIGSIGILVRPKKGITAENRLQTQVFDSHCFTPLREQLGMEEFNRRVAKCYPVIGDIMEDNLGIADEPYAKLTSRVNFVVHLAATIDFHEKINISVKMNVLGSLRVMALCHKSPNIESVVHVSTCYVNYNRRNTPSIEEKLYPLGFDAESMCKYILSLADHQIAPETDRLLKKFDYANTYTFTKAMTEHILQARKGTLPLTIVRPSIVGCAWREPMPGWVDVLTAAGGIFLMIGLGIIESGNLKRSNIADLVPVDHVVNTIIKTQYKTCLQHLARQKPQAIVLANQSSSAVALADGSAKLDHNALSSVSSLPVPTAGGSERGGSDDLEAHPPLPFVFQSCTSTSINNFTWGNAIDSLTDYWNKEPHAKAVGKARVNPVENYYGYHLRMLLLRQFPVALNRVAARLPIVGGEKKKFAAEKLHRGLLKVMSIMHLFSPFLTNVWRFEFTNLAKFLDDGTDREALRENFPSDSYDISWDIYVKLYSYGIVKWIMKTQDGREQPTVPPSGKQVFMQAAL